jgi:hypothetical protein
MPPFTTERKSTLTLVPLYQSDYAYIHKLEERSESVPRIGWLSMTAWRFFILRKGVSKKR